MESYTRSLELRLTADDLPMTRTRVDLDPRFVDEYGFPVARITRELGPHEWQMFTLVEPEMARVFEPFKKSGAIESLVISPAILNLVGDHQMGTCRMGDDPKVSVVDRHCRLHDAKNVFVVDSSFFPTGFGLNPMVTVVANALRVGTHIADSLKKGQEP
jgi:choline dehydrogenase-like flavoprotein